MQTLKILSSLVIPLISTTLLAQSKYADSLLWVNYQYRIAQNQEFLDTNHSPLEKTDLVNFESLNWYPVDTNFMVWAKLTLSPEAEVFEMPTTTERKPQYRQYGTLSFTLGDSLYQVPVYENLRLRKMPQYQDHLFFPFTDLTNGFGTYGGGRYLDLKIPQADSLILDFNRAYNPYCAYNGRYSCPIPPRENHVNYAIRAGVRYRVKH